ncbi:MAG: phenylalanine--tRNA ligase subunit beta [Firmicutes bacterium]|nr:phenylalanine--tRNA ligase subunit beta [Bacillota bacterium]
MRVPYTWLKDFIDLDISAYRLAEMLTHAGIEVEEIKTLEVDFSDVVVAEVVSVEKHPEADRLFVVRVNDGKETRTVVAGIDNFTKGDKVPLAKPGAVLPKNVKIRRARLRGIESHGMLCSAEELGLPLNPGVDGVLVLDKEAPVGVALETALRLADPILVLGLTPNRADCLGLIGVAAEVAALTGKTVQMPDNTLNFVQNELPRPQIEVQAPELCARFAALVIKDVQVAQSPLWLQVRLLQAGIRPISNIVDITNYVMWEWGQPLHAYDYHTLSEQKIIVRRAYPNEILVTLDNQKRSLSEEMLVIADAEKAIGLAGVMGGLDTEVSSETKAVLLEAAHFNAASIRRTGRSFGLYSEAQQRFEKGVDVNGCAEALRRAARLIELLQAGKVDGGLLDEYVSPVYPRQIRLRPERARKLIGLEISQLEMANIFKRQGFGVAEGTQLHVTVPTSRADLREEVDLIEEIARIYGYDKIPTTFLSGQLTQGRLTERQRTLSKIRQLMVACGLSEAICYSFISPRQFDLLKIPQGHFLRHTLNLANPLSEEQSVMRTMLIGGLLSTLLYNQNRHEHNVRLFELGAVFLPAADDPLTALPDERTTLGIAMMGSFPTEHWQQKAVEVDFFTVKGVVETLLTRLGVKDFSFAITELPWCQPGQTAEVRVGDISLGWLGRIHPEVLDNYDLQQPVFAAELDLEKLLTKTQLTTSYTPLPRYPAVMRDLAVVVPETISAAAVMNLIREAGAPWVENVTLFDQYRGPQIPENSRSLAFSIIYRDPSRTLSDDAVAEVHQKIEKALATHLGAGLRG